MSTILKKDFPIFHTVYHRGKPLLYLDSAATSQKPKAVIDAISNWYETKNANIYRGVYKLAEQATAEFEAVRIKVANFIKAENSRSIIFTKGTTEGINLVAQAWAKYNLKSGDTILLTEMEHHANIVPWQMLAHEKKLKLRFWPITETGQLANIKTKTWFRGVKLIGLTHVSNVLGTINPVEKIIRAAHRHKIPVLIDAAQSAPHLPLDIKKMQPDFLVFSGHKMLGPTGIGILYISPKHFSEFKPYQGGGEMIASVSFKKTTFKNVPQLLEAGTQPLAEAIGLAAAIDYLTKISLRKVAQHSRVLVNYTYQQLKKIPEVIIYGPEPSQRCGLISFNLKNIHAHDLATELDQQGIAVRAGHHCAEPLHQRLSVKATVRVSFYLYNDLSEVDVFIQTLKTIIKKWPKHSTAK